LLRAAAQLADGPESVGESPSGTLARLGRRCVQEERRAAAGRVQRWADTLPTPQAPPALWPLWRADRLVAAALASDAEVRSAEARAVFQRLRRAGLAPHEVWTACDVPTCAAALARAFWSLASAAPVGGAGERTSRGGGSDDRARPELKQATVLQPDVAERYAERALPEAQLADCARWSSDLWKRHVLPLTLTAPGRARALTPADATVARELLCVGLSGTLKCLLRPPRAASRAGAPSPLWRSCMAVAGAAPGSGSALRMLAQSAGLPGPLLPEAPGAECAWGCQSVCVPHLLLIHSGALRALQPSELWVSVLLRTLAQGWSFGCVNFALPQLLQVAACPHLHGELLRAEAPALLVSLLREHLARRGQRRSLAPLEVRVVPLQPLVTGTLRVLALMLRHEEHRARIALDVAAAGWTQIGGACKMFTQGLARRLAVSVADYEAVCAAVDEALGRSYAAHVNAARARLR